MRDDLHPLDKDSFYLFQIRGCSVATQEGENVGTVKDIWPIEENNLLVVQRGSREILIPFTKEICCEINLKAKKIVAALPEGLLDLDEI